MRYNTNANGDIIQMQWDIIQSQWDKQRQWDKERQWDIYKANEI